MSARAAIILAICALWLGTSAGMAIQDARLVHLTSIAEARQRAADQRADLCTEEPTP